MTPDEAAPARGSFVRNQAEALRRLGVDVDYFDFPVGKSHYLPAARRIRRMLNENHYDLVHAHYGLAGWSAKFAGAKPLVVTFHGTDVRHRIVGLLSRILSRRIELAAGASAALFAPENGRPGLKPSKGRSRRRTAVLPCGADTDLFRPLPRDEARRRLGLDPDGRYLFFPASPARPVKRFDLATRLAEAADAEILTAGNRPAEEMPLWMNAANAVVVTSDNEGFGLAAVEALACDVPLLSTPVGVAPVLAGNIDGCHVGEWDEDSWVAAVKPHLDKPDPRVKGRDKALAYSADAMARRVLLAYEDLLDPDRIKPEPVTPPHGSATTTGQ